MNDQAARLRSMIGRKTRSIAISSGKGGVGKSNFTLNFALALQQRGCEVLIFDADIGFSNIELLLGTRPKYNLLDVMHGRKTIWDVVHHAHEGIKMISGGSGLHELIRLKEDEINDFMSQINELSGKVDYILFDTGAGLSRESLKVIAAADETWIVTTSEPTSVTDAYAVIKMVCHAGLDPRFGLIVNRVSSTEEGKQTAENIQFAAKRFLNKEIPLIGCIADDAAVTKAVRKQIPFTLLYPNSRAAKDIVQCCSRFLSRYNPYKHEQTSVKGLFQKMVKWMQTVKEREGM